MRSKLLLLLLLTTALFSVQGKMRVFIKPHDMLYTSQKVTVEVELLTDAFSISDVRIHFPASDAFIVRAPQSASFIRQEKIDDTDWQVVHYEYALYPLKAGSIALAPVSADFSASMGHGQPKTHFTRKSESLKLKVAVPKGAKKGGVRSGNEKVRAAYADGAKERTAHCRRCR